MRPLVVSLFLLLFGHWTLSFRFDCGLTPGVRRKISGTFHATNISDESNCNLEIFGDTTLVGFSFRTSGKLPDGFGLSTSSLFLFRESGVTLTLFNCSFYEIDHVFETNSVRNVSITTYNSQFVGNKKLGQLFGTRFDSHSSLFENNTDVFSLESGSLKLSFSVVQNNGFGGGFLSCTCFDFIEIENCLFHKNFAAIGAAIFASNGSTVIIRDTRFSSGGAQVGGALAFVKVENVRVEDCIFTDNMAVGLNDGNSGAILFQQTKEVQVHNTNFTRNSASVNGGSILVTLNTRANFTNCFWDWNRALDGVGGAIGVTLNSTLWVYRGLFNSNNANHGGAIFVWDSHSFVSNSSFLSNFASGEGGAFGSIPYREEGEKHTLQVFQYNKFESNSALNGGALSFASLPSFPFLSSSGSSEIRMLGNTFSKNRASGEGGAVRLQESDFPSRLESNFDNFELNSAVKGGAFSFSGANCIISHAEMTGNSATVEAGTFLFQPNEFSIAGNYSLSFLRITKSYSPVSGGTISLKGAHNFRIFATSISESFTDLEGGLMQISGNVYNFTASATFFLNSKSVLQGGAINIALNANVTHFLLVNMTLTSNRATLYGSAINIKGNVQDIRIFYSKFSISSSFEGGIYIDSASKVSRILLFNSVFLGGGEVKHSGGAFYLGSVSLKTFSIRNCTFQSNLVRSDGAGIFMESTNIETFEIIGSTFDDNKASSGSAIGGNDTHILNLLIHNSTFSKNTASTGGGAALNINLPIRKLNVSCSVFESNLATFGGALYFIPDEFRESHNVSITISQSLFSFNRASIDSGGAIFVSKNLSEEILIDSCVFQENRSQNRGGAIYFSNASTITISNSDFYKNKIVDNRGTGSSVYFDAILNINIFNTKFRSNVLPYGEGVAFYAHGINSSLKMEKNSFSSNEGDGTVVLEGRFKLIETIGGDFSNNTSNGGDGACIGLLGYGDEVENFTVVGVSFKFNDLPISGALEIYTPIYTFEIRDCNFTDGEGRAINLNSDVKNLKISGTVFERNSKGGLSFFPSGLLPSNYSNVDITNSVFRANKASCGAGILIFNANSYIHNCTFDRNVAEQGAAIWFGGQENEIRISNSSFEENRAKTGAALYLNCFAEVFNSTFKSNFAESNGGAIAFFAFNITSGKRSDAVQLKFEMNEVIENAANLEGGGLYLDSLLPPSTIQLMQNLFMKNIAAEGGAISWANGLLLEENSFEGNNASLGSSLSILGTSAYLVSSFNRFGYETIYVPDGSTFIHETSLEVPNYVCQGTVKQGSQGYYCDKTPTSSSTTIQTSPPSSSSSSTTLSAVSEETNKIIETPKEGFNIVIIIVPCVIVVVLVISLAIISTVLSSKLKQRRRYKEARTEIMIMTQLELNDVDKGALIGRGNFGEVYKGTWNGTVVALKGITNENQSELQKFRAEINLLHKLNHPNIVRLLGLHIEENQTYMVVEFAEKGSLDSYLRARDREDELSNNDLIKMSFDVVKGMIYLQKKGIIHRDLAARNLLVDSSNNVKISDFGLSKENDFYEAKSKVIPYKWTAPEVITEQRSTMASDVWSYGVVVWEIFSFGLLPYRDMNNQETIDNLKVGYRLEKPARCPDKIYQMLLLCWEEDPRNRPLFTDLYGILLLHYASVLQGRQDDISPGSNINLYSSISRQKKIEVPQEYENSS